MQFKYLFPFILTFFALVNTTSAQHEFRLGTGIATYPDFKEISKKACDCEDNIKWEGTYNLEYYYRISKDFKIGVSYTLESQHHSEHSTMPGYENLSDVSRKMFHTFLFNNSVSWLTGKWVELYSTLGVGLSLGTNHFFNGSADQGNQFKLKPAYQISPFGIRIGKQWGGFFELGFGYKGLLSGGVSYRL